MIIKRKKDRMRQKRCGDKKKKKDVMIKKINKCDGKNKTKMKKIDAMIKKKEMIMRKQKKKIWS